MIMKCFLFIFLSILLYLSPICCTDTKSTPTSGPFKTTIVSVKNCSNPRQPYVKNSPLVVSISLHNSSGKTILEGNYNVLRDTRDIKMKFRASAWRDGKWEQNTFLKQLDCHGFFLHVTLVATNIKYDRKRCMFLKGSYSFKNLDVDYLQHTWASTMPYGRLIWISENYSNSGMFYCIELDTLTEPA